MKRFLGLPPLLFVTLQLCCSVARAAHAACPETPDISEFMNLYKQSPQVTALQFIKIEKEPTEINSWRFRVTDSLKIKGEPPGQNVSFFTKPHEEAAAPPRFNDRFIAFNEMKNGLTLAAALKSSFLNPGAELPGFCLYRSSVYMEDLIKQTADTEPTRDQACKIQLNALGDSPTIKEVRAFRCGNPDLERKRLVILANSYASAKRYGNATTALELSNGTLNANTLSIVLGWADEWEDKDDRAAKRFVERILNQNLRAHMDKTRQMPAIMDILNDKKRYRRLRDTDWFDDLIKRWITMQPLASPSPQPGPPAAPKLAPKEKLKR